MATDERSVQERFADVVETLENKPGVTYGKPGSKTFGHSALKVHGRIFAMVSSTGAFVVKLPKARVDGLATQGVGKRLEASRGHPMKEWLAIDATFPQNWLELAHEAMCFVGTVP